MNLAAVGAVLGFLGVAAGAFGAHALRDSVTAERLAIFETAARYHLVHALAILAAHLLRAPFAGWAFLAGTIVFSGSLYLLVVLDRSWLGAVTPIGGVLLLAGWAALAVAASGR